MHPLIVGRAVAFALALASAPAAGAARDGDGLATPQDAAEFSHLTIAWLGQTPSAWSTKDMAVACDRLGKALVAGGGPWGLGAFRSFGCYLDDHLIAGRPGTSSWIVTLDTSSRAFSIAWHLQRASSSPVELGRVVTPVYELSLAPIEWLGDFLRHEASMRLIAATLLFRLPALGRLEVSAYAAREQRAPVESFPDCATAPEPPARLVVTASAGGESLGESRFVEEEGGGRWRLSRTRPALATDALLLVADGDASGTQRRFETCLVAAYRASALERDPLALERLVAKAGTLEEYASSALTVPFAVGMRYGIDFRGSAALFGRPATLFGLLVESRWGPLEGLSARYDFIPTLRGETTKLAFGMRRMQAAWSFHVELPFIGYRANLAPKLGMWDLESAIVFEDPSAAGGRGALPVRLTRAMSVGGEGDVEITAPSSIIRPWASRDATLAKSGLPTTVVGTRFGIDAIVNAFSFGGKRSVTHLSPMAFVLRESMRISTRMSAQTSSGAGTVEALGFDLEYTMTYGGAGLAIVW